MQLWHRNKINDPQKVLAEDEYEKAHQLLRKHLIEQYRTRLKSNLAFSPQNPPRLFRQPKI